MNLKIGHLPVLIGGALPGSALGYLLCVAARSLFRLAQDVSDGILWSLEKGKYSSRRQLLSNRSIG